MINGGEGEEMKRVRKSRIGKEKKKKMRKWSGMRKKIVR